MAYQIYNEITVTDALKVSVNLLQFYKKIVHQVYKIGNLHVAQNNCVEK